MNIIRQVWRARRPKGDVLLITVPQGEGLVEGDYVKLVKVKQ